MLSLKTIGLLVGLGVIVAIYWALGSGALGTGDRQLDATIPGQASGVRSSPSAGAAGPLNPGAAAGPDGSRGAAPVNRPPALALVSPASIVPENVVVASGQGFDPGEQVEVVVSNGAKALVRAGAVADKDGNFYGVNITITAGSAPGQYAVNVQGKKSGRKAESSLQVVPSAPYAEPSTYSGKGGTAVTLEGGGFKPGEIVSMHFDSLAVDPVQQVIADQDGLVSLTGNVPLAEPGEHAFILVGAQSSFPLRIPFSVIAFSPWIAPTNYSPIPQQRLGFAGHDFAPGEEISFYLGKVVDHPIAVTRAGQDGNFEAPELYELPVDSVGEQVFVAVGRHTRTAVSTSVEVLPFNPALELSVYAGMPGTAVSFKGAGYARGETVVAYLGGTSGGQEVARFQAGEDGAFEGAGSFNLPNDAPAGDVTISAVGETSKLPIEISFAVLPLTPSAGLTSYAGPPGTIFSFQGVGFLPRENVTVHLGNSRSPALATVQADETGAFSGGGSYSVPEDAKGKIDFVVVGQSSKAEATAAFTVTEGGGEGEQPAGSGGQPAGEGEKPAEQPADRGDGAGGEN